MNRRIQATRLTTASLASLLLVFYGLFAPVNQVFALEAPTKPTAPTAPVAPTAPEAPQAPEAPEAPEAPTSPRDVSEANEPEDTEETEEAVSDTNKATQEETQESTDQTSTQASKSSPGTTSDTNNNGMGDSEIDTGDATTIVSANNAVNNNSAEDGGSNDENSVDLTNSGNGSGSDNTNDVDLTKNKDTVQVNTADIENGVEAESVTGENENSRNVGNSTTNTGDANVSATVITTANTNAEGISANEFNVVDDYVGDIILNTENPCATGCQTGEVIVLKNSGNGSNSNNNNQATVEDKNNTFQYNDADLENDIVLSANSGDNVSKDNTGGDTEINTGDANVSANVISAVNNNIAGAIVINTVNIFGDLIGDIVAPEATPVAGCTQNCSGSGDIAMVNSGNGVDSDNNNHLVYSEEDLVIQDNTAVINNGVTVDTNTGNNSVSDNTGGNNKVTTGESTVDVNVVNIANQNVVNGEWWIVLVNEAGNWIGQIMGAPEGSTMAGSEGTQFIVHDDGSIDIVNSGNGSNSNNNNSVQQSTSNTIVQENNANIDNNLVLSANTGGNTASRNTGGNSKINTGDANVVANLVNFINNNIVGGGKVNVTVINVFGSWVGNFRGPGHQVGENAVQSNPVADSSSQENHHQPAIGGYATEPDQSQDQSESTTPVLLANTAVNQAQPLGSGLIRSRGNGGNVLGLNQAEIESDSSENEENITGSEYVTEEGPENSESGPITVKVTWPGLFTSLLGLVYAGLRTRGIFFA